MKRKVLVVAVVTLAALAGCGGNSGTTTLDGANGETTVAEDSGPTTTDGTTPTTAMSTTTERSTTTTTESTTTTLDVDLPPGTSRQGITDWEVLQSAHASGTAGADFRVSGTFREVHNGTDSLPRRTVLRTEVRVSSTERRLFGDRQITRGPGGTNSSRVVFLDNGTTYSRRSAGGNVSYDVTESFTFQQGRVDLAIATVNSEGVDPLRWEWTLAGTTTVDGREAVRYSLVGMRSFAEDAEVRRTNGTAVIDARGVIHRIDANALLVDPVEGQRELSFSYRYEPASSVDIDRPEWLEAARNATNG